MLLKNKLIDLCMAEESGQYGVPYPAEEYDSSKYRYLRITDISDDGCLLDNDLKSVSGDNIDSYILSENDIVFARTGNSTGRSYLYDKRHGLLVYAGFLIRYKIDQSKINPKYLHYFTNSSYYKQWVKNLSNGSTRGNINAQTFADCDIIYPSRQQQDILVNTVSAIDEKISLNTRMNAELEAMAKQLYDYWFVQFDFPDENGNPYKSSGGEMVYNSTLKREIPEGWDNVFLSDIANITMGQSPDGSSYNEMGKGTVFYQGSTDFGIRFPSVRMYTTAPSRFAKKGDILMSVRAPVGDTNIANKDCCIGRGLSAINSKLGSISHLYYIIRDLKAKFDMLNAAGTTFGAITKDELYNMPVVKPSKDILSKYEDLCSPIFDMQMTIGYEIDHLTHLRDSLLPMLMNGQVTVE